MKYLKRFYANLISLQGRHLDVFNAVPGLVVTVGNNPCVVTNISATTVLCKPPELPEVLSPDGHAVVIVRRFMLH